MMNIYEILLTIASAGSVILVVIFTVLQKKRNQISLAVSKQTDTDDEDAFDDEIKLNNRKGSIKTALKKFIFSNYEDYDDYEEEYEDYYDDYNTGYYSDRGPVPSFKTAPKMPEKKIIPSQMIVCKPTSIDDAASISDYLAENKVCIVNLEEIDTSAAQRIVDFLAGVTYRTKGGMQRVESRIFVVSHNEIDLTPNLKEHIIKLQDGFQLKNKNRIG